MIYRQQVKQYSPRCLCTPSPTMLVMHVTSRKCPAQPSPNERARAESIRRGRRVSKLRASWLSGLCGCGEPRGCPVTGCSGRGGLRGSTGEMIAHSARTGPPTDRASTHLRTAVLCSLPFTLSRIMVYIARSTIRQATTLRTAPTLLSRGITTSQPVSEPKKATEGEATDPAVDPKQGGEGFLGVSVGLPFAQLSLSARSSFGLSLNSLPKPGRRRRTVLRLGCPDDRLCFTAPRQPKPRASSGASRASTRSSSDGASTCTRKSHTT